MKKILDLVFYKGRRKELKYLIVGCAFGLALMFLGIEFWAPMAVVGLITIILSLFLFSF